jgi:lysozyme family protein
MEAPMAAANYDAALQRLLAHEGGYSNHPADPGGPTKFGITIRDYRRYVNPRAGAADVRAMRLDEAKAIYRARYWDAMHCDGLPPGVDYSAFDYAVNSGTGRAGKVLRRLCGLSDGDSAVTDAVLHAVARREPKALIVAINDERLAFLRRLRTWPTFGAGWGRRVAEVRTFSLRLARQSAQIVPAPGGPAPGKGSVPINSAAQNATAGGIAVAGTAAAQQAHAAGARIGVVIAVVATAIVLAAVGWLAWRWRQKRLQEA